MFFKDFFDDGVSVKIDQQRLEHGSITVISKLLWVYSPAGVHSHLFVCVSKGHPWYPVEIKGCQRRFCFMKIMRWVLNSMVDRWETNRSQLMCSRLTFNKGYVLKLSR